MNPRNLTNAMMNQIGIDYCTKHPKKTCFHGNQSLAKELEEYNKKSNPEAKWKDLLEIYGRLRKPKGELAQAMDKLFTDAFGIYCIVKAIPARSAIYSFSTSEVVAKLTMIVNKYFSSPLEKDEKKPDEQESCKRPLNFRA